MRVFIEVVLVCFLSTVKGQNNGGVRCLECHNSRTPEACDNWVMCGRGEICYAREIEDFGNNQAFHLGCEDKARCDLFANAKALIGKREESDLDLGFDLDQWDPDLCYQCCPQDDCNSRLCHSSVRGHAVTNTSGSKPLSHSCPPTFVTGPHTCYYFANWTLSWEAARLDCQRRGADLVSIDSQQEQDFLVNHLNKTDTRYLAHTGYWTGGIYVTATREWIWVDMTKVIYKHWGPREPTSSNYNIRLSLHNPHTYPTYPQWQWSAAGNTAGLGFICERNFV